jgi:hypothetical protein
VGDFGFPVHIILAYIKTKIKKNPQLLEDFLGI